MKLNPIRMFGLVVNEVRFVSHKNIMSLSIRRSGDMFIQGDLVTHSISLKYFYLDGLILVNTLCPSFIASRARVVCSFGSLPKSIIVFLIDFTCQSKQQIKLSERFLN